MTTIGARRSESLLSLAGRSLRVASSVTLLLVLRYALTILGLGAIVTGCFLLSLACGCIVLGVALLVLEWVVKQ